jgi:hypothetical protein
MSRVEQAFAKGKALIPFITAGDPDLKTTEQLILEIAWATFIISSFLNPRVVNAGVPKRIPLVTVGFSGSKGNSIFINGDVDFLQYFFCLLAS